MHIWVCFFASAREQVGAGQVQVELPADATVQTLMGVLFQKYPGLSLMRLRFAVNAVYVAPDARLRDGDKVALIPPVGGG